MVEIHLLQTSSNLRKTPGVIMLTFNNLLSFFLENIEAIIELSALKTLKTMEVFTKFVTLRKKSFC